MRDGLLFTNAVAKAKEETLFSGERLSRMLEAASLADAVKILQEASYGGGAVIDDPADFEVLLAGEHEQLIEFLRSVKVENAGFECFFLKADYHNAKAILKAKYQGEDPERMLVGGGLIPVATLKEKLLAEVPNVNRYIDKAVAEIKRAFETARSPRVIDTVLDRAMHEDIADRLEGQEMDASVRQYLVAYTDCINISTYVRAARIGANPSFFLANFLPGGKVEKKTFSDIYPDVAKLAEHLKYSDYRALSEMITGEDLTEFDTARDDYLLNIFRENRHDLFTIAPAMGYYLAKLTEIKVLRIVLVCIKNEVDKNEIKKRLRSLYA